MAATATRRSTGARLADRNVFVLPGSLMNAPAYFRISLTASDDMVERALPVFRDVGHA